MGSVNSTQAVRSARFRATLFRIILIVPGLLVLAYEAFLALTPGIVPPNAPRGGISARFLMELAAYSVVVVSGLAIYSQGKKLSVWQLIRWWLPANLVVVGVLALGWWYRTTTTATAGTLAYCVTLIMIGGRTRSYGNVVIYGTSLAGLAFVPYLLALEAGYVTLMESCFLAVLCAVVAYYWRYLRRSRELLNREVQVEVRKGMARDLHDLVAHEVTGMMVLAKAAAAAPQGETSREALTLIEAAGGRAMTHIRVLVSTHDQDERTLPEAQLSTELATLIEAFQATTQAKVLSNLEPIDGLEVPAPAHIAGYKIVSEALTNIRRHAQSADHVKIEATCEEQILTLVVSDNGRGGGLGSGTGTGTASMAERAALVGGTVDIGRDRDDWWTVTARLPLTHMTSLDQVRPHK